MVMDLIRKLSSNPITFYVTSPLQLQQQQIWKDVERRGGGRKAFKTEEINARYIYRTRLSHHESHMELFLLKAQYHKNALNNASPARSGEKLADLGSLGAGIDDARLRYEDK